MLEGAFGRKPHEEVDFTLNLQPQQRAVTRAEFEENYPQYSIAADGYVQSPTFDNLPARILNRDHHEGAHRLSTLWSAGQIWMDVRMGLYQLFRDQYGPRVNLHINDCDEDDAACKLLLEAPHLVYKDKGRRLEKLIDLMGKMDATAGAYPVDLEDPDIRSVFWITDPYREFRNNGLNRRNAAEYLDVLDQVGKRMKLYIEGKHQELSPDTNYTTLFEQKPINGQGGWIMIEETGKQSRIGAIAQGHQAIVSYRPLAEGRSAFVITRLSPYITYFDLPAFKNYFNSVDDVADWGGASDIVIGSPRGVGSKFTPDQIQRAISEMLVQARIIGPANRQSRIELAISGDIAALRAVS